ncbi:hypothetical protein LWF15_03805 [Kineosporia rhizophila]|uniref:hypothetical protein n=1 Tax=Kineosporia TaxID=49184 RepID=UPI001E5FFFD1|nr:MULTISPECIES: hypothetical protein [Kineosporia]MCE0534624.1 hypothetical protein [Kineosporia rhizophila]GLY15585.1 hypothetical protein Kisp01_26000 [Kineosporia sp. NBRC 101677]
MIALLLDLSNIVGGLLLGLPLLRLAPRGGEQSARLISRIDPWAWIVGVVALVTGGYYLIVHLVSGPHLFHFEVVGLAVGVILLWDRLTGRPPLRGQAGPPEGTALVLAIFGLIAVVVGLQGLFTPN